MRSVAVTWVAANCLAVALLAAPAQAQTTLERPSCTLANIASTEEKVLRMQDSPQKSTATTELDAARATLQQGNIEACQDHLLKANLQTK